MVSCGRNDTTRCCRTARSERYQAGLLSWAGPNYDLSFIPKDLSNTSKVPSLNLQNMIFLLLKNFWTCQTARKFQIEQFSFLVQFPNPSRIGIIKFRINIWFESCLNFKAVPTVRQNSHKFLNILTSHKLQEYEFTLAHLHSKIWSSFTSGKYDSV
jgi:hypothetical protein